MKKILFLVLGGSFLSASAQVPGEWTWMSGDSTVNSTGVFGTKGIPDASNAPPGLYQSCGVTDLDGNFWLFGGANFENDGDARTFNSLWKFNVLTLEWTWMKGSSSAIKFGVYGTKGVADINNTPGSRYGTSIWIDSLNNLWLFGGIGFASSTADLGYGNLNDLWKYDISSNQWTWMHGSDDAIAGLNIPQYGQMEIPDSSNTPNGRWQCNNWTDKEGMLWLFGGYNNENSLTGYYNDLWRYNPATNEWTWMKGDSIPGQLGSFGTLGIANSTNNPSARACQAHWVDGDGDLWLLGGYASSYTTFDLWQYEKNVNSWVWWGGGTFNAPPFNGILCWIDSLNFPTDRSETSFTWKVGDNDLWIFGGYGFSLMNNVFSAKGDLWKYNSISHQWIRVYGVDGYLSGIFGQKGIPTSTNRPMSRFGGVSWQDTSGNFWLFGGIYDYDYNDQTDCFNDLWRYVPDTACGVFTLTTEIEIERNKFEIYPNPTTGRFTIEFNESQLGEEEVVVELRALVGNILEQHHLPSTNGYLKKELDLDQPAGIYLITVCSKNDCITQKLMIVQ